MRETPFLHPRRPGGFDRSHSLFCVGKHFENTEAFVHFLEDPENQLQLDRSDRKVLFDIVRRNRLGVVTDRIRIMSSNLKYVRSVYAQSFCRRPYVRDCRPFQPEDDLVLDHRFVQDAFATAFAPLTCAAQEMSVWRATCEGVERFSTAEEALRHFGFDDSSSRCRAFAGADFVVEDTFARTRCASSVVTSDPKDELLLELILVRPDVEAEHRMSAMLRGLHRFASKVNLTLVVDCANEAELRRSLFGQFEVRRRSVLDEEYCVVAERTEADYGERE